MPTLIQLTSHKDLNKRSIFCPVVTLFNHIKIRQSKTWRTEPRPRLLATAPNDSAIASARCSEMLRGGNPTGTYLSRLGVWTDSCPLVEACGLMIKEVLDGAEEETQVVDRSRLLWLLLAASSAVCEPVTSFQSCCSSVGIMPETNKLDN